MNGEPGYSWDGKTTGTRAPSLPALGEGDELLYTLPGRCGGVDAHCHEYLIVRNAGDIVLLVRHGGGEERHRLASRQTVLRALVQLDEPGRYWFCHALYFAVNDARKQVREETAARWRTAAAEKRIKVRKVRNSALVKVEIIDPRVLQLRESQRAAVRG